jgi:hypothetical protein
MIDQLSQTAIVSALMAGFDRYTIEEKGLDCNGLPEADENLIIAVGEVLNMSRAGSAMSLREAFVDQGFTREEALQLVCASMSSNK